MAGKRSEDQREKYWAKKEIPYLLSNMKKYSNKLFIKAKGGTYYPQTIVGIMEPLTKIVENIGWWLQHTKQGMWQAPLQFTEDTTCLGWSLYLAKEYDQEALWKEIWAFMGVHIALWFWEVDNGILRKGENKPTWPKALHIEIHMAEQSVSQKHIEKLYYSQATTFPLGIKMWQVRDYCLLTNTHVKAKAASLHINQQRFFQQMETCISWEIARLDLPDKILGANLHHLIMNIPDPEKPCECLFHAVNKMFCHDGYIFQFHPHKNQTAREVVTGLLVFLQGTWAETIDANKFHNFLQPQQLNVWWMHCGMPKIAVSWPRQMQIWQISSKMIWTYFSCRDRWYWSH